MDIIQFVIGAFIAMLATSIGALAVLPFRVFDKKLYAALLAFAAGVMAYSSVEMLSQSNKDGGSLAAAFWFLAGVLLIAFMERTLPHLHYIMRKKQLARSKKKVALIAGTISIHNIPEGFAIASAFAGSPALGWLVTTSIALQDAPEGFLVSAPLMCYGLSKSRSLFFGIFSGIVEFLAAIVGYILLVYGIVATPVALAFSAGAMTYVILVELLPDSFKEKQWRIALLSFISGILLAFAIAVLFSL